MDNNKYQDLNIEVDVKDLCWSILTHWKLLLAALLVSGVLLGAYKGHKEFKIISDAGEVKARQEAYETALSDYEKQKIQLESELKNLRASQERQEYLQNNALMLHMDQYNVVHIATTYFMEIGQQTDMEKEWVVNYAQSLIKRYQAAVIQLDLDKVIVTEEEPELTSVNPAGTSRKLLETATDGNVSILYVTVRADSEERAEKIYTEVEKTLLEQEEMLIDVKDRYHLTKISEKRYNDVDSEIGKVQTNFENSVQSTEETIANKEKQLSDLKKPTNTTPSVKSAIMSTVKYGIVGAVAGLFAAAFVVMVFIVLRDRMNSTEEVSKRYRLPVFGTIAVDKKKTSKLNSFFEKCLGFNDHGSAETAADYAVSNIRFPLKDSARLLLVGSCASEKLNVMKDLLASRLEGVEVAAAGNINENAAAVDALRSGAAVICVEEWMKTPHKAIRRELQTVADSGSRVLGFIAVK